MNFRKSLLALSIVTASLPAFAVDLSYSAGVEHAAVHIPMVQVPQKVTDAFTKVYGRGPIVEALALANKKYQALVEQGKNVDQAELAAATKDLKSAEFQVRGQISTEIGAFFTNDFDSLIESKVMSRDELRTFIEYKIQEAKNQAGNEHLIAGLESGLKSEAMVEAKEKAKREKLKEKAEQEAKDKAERGAKDKTEREGKEQQEKDRVAKLKEQQEKDEAARLKEQQEKDEAARLKEQQEKDEAARLKEQQEKDGAERLKDKQEKDEAAQLKEQQEKDRVAKLKEQLKELAELKQLQEEAQFNKFLAENKDAVKALRALESATWNNPEVAAYLKSQLANKSTAERIKLLKQAMPEVNDGASRATQAAQNLTSNAISSRTSSMRSGLSSGDGVADTGVWVQALTSKADQGERGGVAGYSANSRGIAVGVDGKLNEQVTLGLAFSSLNTDVKSQGGNSTDVTSHALTVYSGFEQDGFFADGSMTLGRSANASKRHIGTDLAKGDYDSQLFGVNAMAGYAFDMGQGVVVEPRVAGRYSLVRTDGYSEKGARLGLNMASQDFEVAELGAGIRMKGSFELGKGSIEPEVTAMAYHDFVADSSKVASSYVLGGTPFVTSAAKPASDSYEVGVGMNYRLGAVSMGVNYDYTAKQNFKADTVKAQVRYEF